MTWGNRGGICPNRAISITIKAVEPTANDVQLSNASPTVLQMSLLLKCLKLLSPIENTNTAHFPTTTKILPELQDMHQLVT